ncbi:MAG TPA: methyltransferase domain-containing protein [Candidatus Sulfotelmatobacter sp.]|nr:methyltransferase domain-containing protein [Candidatus Sulfotelmatobacter sp.]
MTEADTQIDQLQQPNIQAAMGDQSASRTVVDIGCGQKKVPGAIGVDCVPLPGVDVVHDLDSFPYPFAASSIDEIHAYHVLEHVPDVMATMEELWRISKPGATVHIRVPHFSGILAWKDPTHKRSFTSESFGYFGENGYSYYTRARFQVMSVSLRYSIQPKNRWIERAFAKVTQWLLDRHPTFGERHLAYLVGGIDEVQATLKTIKPDA